MSATTPARATPELRSAAEGPQWRNFIALAMLAGCMSYPWLAQLACFIASLPVAGVSELAARAILAGTLVLTTPGVGLFVLARTAQLTKPASSGARLKGVSALSVAAPVQALPNLCSQWPHGADAILWVLACLLVEGLGAWLYPFANRKLRGLRSRLLQRSESVHRASSDHVPWE